MAHMHLQWLNNVWHAHPHVLSAPIARTVRPVWVTRHTWMWITIHAHSSVQLATTAMLALATANSACLSVWHAPDLPPNVWLAPLAICWWDCWMHPMIVWHHAHPSTTMIPMPATTVCSHAGSALPHPTAPRVPLGPTCTHPPRVAWCPVHWAHTTHTLTQLLTQVLLHVQIVYPLVRHALTLVLA